MRETFISNELQRVAEVVASIAARHSVKAMIGANESLVDAGLSSVAMVELMLAVEHEFAISIPDDDLSAANFFNIVAVAALVDRLGANGRSAVLEFPLMSQDLAISTM